MYTYIFFEKSRTENAILLIRDEEGFEFSTSKCWSWKIYISVWKKGLKNRRGKDWIGEKNNRRGRICLGISIRLGEKFVGKNRTNVWGFPPRGRLPVGNDRCRERLAIVRPEREVEEEGSGRGNLGRNKAVITLVPQLTGQLIKSRGLLIPASLSLYFSTNLDKAGYSPTVLIIFNSSRLGNVR